MKLERYLDGRLYFYLMHLSYGTGREDDREEHWNYARENKLIGLDLPDDVPKNWNDMSDSEKQSLRRRRPMWYKQFELFCNEMKKDDLVVVVNGWDSLLGIGKVSQPKYNYCKILSETRTFFDHVRNIKWEMAQNYHKRIPLPVRLNGFNNTLLKVKVNTRFWMILSNIDLG